MKYVFAGILYLALLILHLPLGATSHHTPEFPANVYFCQDIDCPALLLNYLQNYPDGRCAFYDIGETSLRNYFRNSTHKVLVDKDALDTSFQERFTPVNSLGLMHHKFCIFNSTVFTGSWNPTLRGSYFNDNYVLILSHPEIARIYSEEFANLQRKRSFSPTMLHTPTSSYEFLFCPQHHCEENVLEHVLAATTRIQLLSFTFTSPALGEALVEKVDQGVSVEVVQETRQAGLSRVDENLLAAGVALRYDTNPYTMHGKVWILDNHTLILGSYNPTRAGTTKNNENLVIIQNNTALLEAFQGEFTRIWNLSE